MANVVGEIASDAQQQCADIDGVARKIAEVETTNRENANLLERARESAQELLLLSQELGGSVGRFHIEAQGDVPQASQGVAAARQGRGRG
jgi:methyl-accepting chemotaxis protein